MATVRYTDFSLNNPTGWSWNFGEGAVPGAASSKGPHLIDYSTGGVKTVSLTTTNAAGSNTRVKYVPVTAPPPLTETFNAIIWDGTKFVLVGDNGTIATTFDGTLPIRRSVPAGVEGYKLTGVASHIGTYIVVGTKTISTNNYRLLILTSTDSVTWEIDQEIDFFSYDDPAISTIDVFYGNSEFVINGSTLHVIKGHPGEWSDPIETYNPWTPTRGLIFKDGFYYEVVNDFDCAYTHLGIIKYDVSFNYIANYIVDTLRTSSSERLPFIYDTARSLWVVAYNNELDTEPEADDKFTIATSTNLTTWVKEVDTLSTLIPNGTCLLGPAGSYVVGGNSTNTGIVYSYNGSSWSNTTSGEVSLNSVAYNGYSVVLAVGYHGAIVRLPIPEFTATFNSVAWCGSEFIVVGDAGTIVSTVDGLSHTHKSVPAGVEAYKLTGIAYNSGVYVVVGTKTISLNNYGLLILTSLDGTTWEIDQELVFTSSYDPSISTIEVFYGNSEFVINGSTLHIIKGHPGEWSDPIMTEASWLPTVGLIFAGGYYYEVVRAFDCVEAHLSVLKYDTSFNYISDYIVDNLMTDDHDRLPFFYDTARSRWVISYHNEVDTETGVDDKFTIITSANLNVWVKEVEASSTLLSNGSCFVSPVSGAYIVGGNSETDGIIYSFNGSVWSDISTTEVSLNAVAFDGVSLALAVGYRGALVNLPTITPAPSFNNIVWDGSKFIIVGDSGLVKSTVDGTSLTPITVPAGVANYKLTGIAHHSYGETEEYIIVGTKKISANNFRLLILASYDSVTWTIDEELDFSSSYDPAISSIAVAYCVEEEWEGFVINGSTLQIIKGHTSSWSDPIQLEYYDYIPIKSLVCKDGFYYILIQDNACDTVVLQCHKFNSDFSEVPAYIAATDTTYDGNYERCPFFFDTVRSLWVVSYYNTYLDKFIVATSIDLAEWNKKVNYTSIDKFSNGAVLIEAGPNAGKTYVVGGDSTTGGTILSFNGALWSDVTSGQVSLNAVGSNGSDLILAVGYHEAVVTLPIPTQISTVYNDVVSDGSKFIIVGSGGTVKSTTDGLILTNITVPAGVGAYNLTGISYAAIDSTPTYVVVGTKTVSAGNYSLLILVSNNGTSWTIDSEIAFASSYDPAISKIKVFFQPDSAYFVINGSTVQVITGVPGAWSSNIVLPDYGYLPLKCLIFKDPEYYAVFVDATCFGDGLIWVKYNTLFSAVLDEGLIEGNAELFGHDERCVLFWDADKSLWVASYYNHVDGKLVVSVSIDMVSWSKQTDVLTSGIPNGAVTTNNGAYIAGGNSTTSGFCYFR